MGSSHCEPHRATEPVISHACNCCSCSYVCRRRCRCCCCAFKGQRLSAQQSIHNHTLRLSCAFFLHRLRLPQVPKIASAIENDRDYNIAHCHKLPLIRSMRCDLLARLNSWPASPRTLDSPLFLLPPPLPPLLLSDPQLTRSLSGRPWYSSH